MSMRRLLLRIALPLVCLVVLIASVPVLLPAVMGIMSSSVVRIVYHQGSNWVQAPPLGDVAYDLYTAPDDKIWAMTSSGLFRWNNNDWQKIYTPTAHPVDFKLNQTSAWLVTHENIVRCDTVALTCQSVQNINVGYAIAAFGERVYAVTRDGELVWSDGKTWQRDSLVNLLPGFDPSRGDSTPKLAFTNDGTLWLEWYQIWRYKGKWTAVTLGGSNTEGVRLTGVTPGRVWLEFNNGLAAVQPDLQGWAFYTWEEMKGPGPDWTFQLTAAPDGTIWAAVRNGVLFYANNHWELIPLPNMPIVSAVAVTRDGTVWTQATYH